MDVRLISAAALATVAQAIKTCTGGGRNFITDTDECNRLIRLCISKGHESVLEHMFYSFEIQGISRALLQELSRHRHISLSVKSTRYALNKATEEDYREARDRIEALFLRENGDTVNSEEIRRLTLLDRITCLLSEIRLAARDGVVSNDALKYALPEAMPTDLILTVNARELRHILRLRTDKAALPEFQALCREMLRVIRSVMHGTHNVLFEDIDTNGEEAETD